MSARARRIAPPGSLTRRFGTIAALLWLTSSSVADGQVKWRVGEDGRRVMYNDARSRRASPAPPRPAAAPASVDASVDGAVDIDAIVDAHAGQNDLDPKLVHAVIRVESAYNAQAVSHKGAIGLMQLMPATARDLAVDNPYDPEQNVRGGTLYLRRMLDRFGGDLQLALAGYNAGPEAVARYEGIPPYDETVNYVEKVLRIYRGDQSFALPRPIVRNRGRKTYLVRRNGRMVMTTSRPRRR